MSERTGPVLRRRELMGALVIGAGAAACSAVSTDDRRAADAVASEEAASTHLAALTWTPGHELPSIHPEIVPVASLPQADPAERHTSYVPEMPPAAVRTEPAVFDVDLEVLEGVCPLDPAGEVTTLMWGYRVAGDTDTTCGTPGPVLRGRVGDVARIRLTNLPGNTMAHNIDFHAVTGQGGGAEALTVLPGEVASIEVRLLYPGAFMYHCAFGDVPEHIVRGMYGMFVVDPETPMPHTEHEWALVQSEWYVQEPDADGLAELDRDALLAETPRYVTFNGRTDALAGDNALHMEVGQRARIFMVNEGLNLASNFHPIGSHWDAVWPEAAIHEVNQPIRGSQSTLVVAGGGTVVDLVGLVPSTIILVDHALVRTFYKGAIGQVVVEGRTNAELFSSTAAAASGAAAVVTEEAPSVAEGPADVVSTDTVSIPDGAFDPANSDRAYDPPAILVSVGTTVTWTNDDVLPHTVTAGTTDGRTPDPDGRFDSGDMAPGDTFAFTFDEAGEYPYFCTPHPWMQGLVIVEEG